MTQLYASGHLRVRQGTRAEVWYAQVRLPGDKRTQKAIGRVWRNQKSACPPGYLTQRQALSVLGGMLNEANNGLLAVQQAVGVTFAEAAREWLRHSEHDRRCKDSTMHDYRSAVESVYIPSFGEGVAFSAISAQHIEAFKKNLLRDGRDPKTVNKHLRHLNGIYRRGMRIYGLKNNPVAAVDRVPVIDSGDFDVLDATEVDALIKAAASTQDAAIFTLAAHLGLRLGELRAVEWQDVDWGRGLVFVRRNFTHKAYGTPKSGKVRSVPMSEQVIAALDDLRRRERFTEPNDLIFCNAVGGIIDESALRRRYKKALTHAGLRPLRFHDLRHTFGTTAVQGLRVPEVQDMMGHASITTTSRYLHWQPRQDAAAKLTALFSVPEAEVQSRVGFRVATPGEVGHGETLDDPE